MFKIGCDPECFLLNADGQVISAIGRIGGSKQRPKRVLTAFKRGFALQEDNVLLEYNIPPARSFSEFTDYLDMIHEYIDDLLKTMGLKRSRIASCSMNPEEMTSHKAWQFGCEPDFNAWTLEINPRPVCDDLLFRSAGGHIHLGGDYTYSQKISIVRWLDVYLGEWLKTQDPDKDRQKLYGAPGAMRIKKYGLEYRVPSNWWTFQDKETLATIYDQITHAISSGSNGQIEAPMQAMKAIQDAKGSN